MEFFFFFFFFYNLFYINFLQVFSIKFAVNLFSRHLVYFSGTTMEIRVTRPFIVSFIPGDQYGGPDCFISCLHVLFTEIDQIKKIKKIKGRTIFYPFLRIWTAILYARNCGYGGPIFVSRRFSVEKIQFGPSSVLPMY